MDERFDRVRHKVLQAGVVVTYLCKDCDDWWRLGAEPGDSGMYEMKRWKGVLYR